MENNGLSLENAILAEEMYQVWKKDRKSVPDGWNRYFSNLDKLENSSIQQRTKTQTPAAIGVAEKAASPENYKSSYAYKQGRVDSLIWAYRDVGYLFADLNPLEYMTREHSYLRKTIEGNYESLKHSNFGLNDEDLDVDFRSGRTLHPSKGKLSDILSGLRETYCSYMGVEVLHIQNRTMRGWLIERLEENNNRPLLTAGQKRLIQEDLIKAEEFETFLHKKFIGQKRFSLEGSEAVIPALHYLIDTTAADLGIKEITLGMAHRGRLNVLSNLMHKPYEEIFSTFEEQSSPHEVGGSGDVKYHLGFSTDHVNVDGKIHISLVANPSHLEAVDPIVEGKARGTQRRHGDTHRKKVIPVLIHGDTAFTGQGVVAETFNLAQLKGYRTGGTVHIIINNQIGFTTAQRDARSTFFCTDVAKVMPVPIFHVNGNHPDYVVRAIDLAIRFRQKFGYDAVVDIFCFRKFGHNEADDPSFTHPIMYQKIKNAKAASRVFGKQLHDEGLFSLEDQEAFRRSYQSTLDTALKSARSKPVQYINDGFRRGDWEKYDSEYDHNAVVTGVNDKTLLEIGKKITTSPKRFGVHKKLGRILEAKRKMFDQGDGFDWATAESLAFGTLLLEGHPIRLSGEDSGRGTFSQRHAVWWDTATDEPEPYMPLANLSNDQARFRVYDSPLSEYSVLGFEYGNALAQPEMLTIWEAQFGDFSNGAQVIIDQFVAAGETKWDRGNGLVMLLPHGYEGQGPEHSSAHLERFLQLCAEDNIQVCNASTPAQYFHLLRRQLKRPFRKPLIIMTPKSLLRNREATSSLSELTTGHFQEVLDDPRLPKKAERIVLCSGKAFYNLTEQRDEKEDESTAIIRIEQLYPFPQVQLQAILNRYYFRELVWAQEESRNRGAWTFIRDRSDQINGTIPIRYVGRKESASPATGSYKQHQLELKEILSELFP